MMPILKLIRWKNLVMIAAIQILIKHALLQPFNVSITLNWFGFSLLVLSTLCIAAGGYIINDIQDIEADTANKVHNPIALKEITLKAAYNWYIGLTILGVLIGLYLSHLINKSGFFAIFVITSLLLYLYSTTLKKMLLVGNIVIALLVAFSIIIVGLFELFPAIKETNMATQRTFFGILMDYAVFAFLLTFTRELAKDIEDIDGDYKAGMNTLPISLGRERATKVLFGLMFLPIGAVVYYIASYLYRQPLSMFYFLLFILAPLLYLLYKTYSAEKKADYSHISFFLKLIMVSGMLSLLIYRYILL
ncbi:MAG: geranylgeranylglycerol-phosphate geranylgeranyltransferase [Flavobacteriaceae bacterium]|nr:geranylgeranylglycerol-phosphate geranylgeranyltransferase [Flavobacteriaceae bacterium]